VDRIQGYLVMTQERAEMTWKYARTLVSPKWDRGLYIFPLHHIRRVLADGTLVCTCPDGARCGQSAGKHPRFEGWQQAASNDRATIDRSWNTIDGEYRGANIGISCERSGILVLDADRHTPGEDGLDTIRQLEAILGPLPFTWCIATGGGGQQWYFDLGLAPGEPYPSFAVTLDQLGIGPAVDVQGKGKLVVAPGSLTAAVYRFLEGEDGVNPFAHDCPAELRKRPARCPDALRELLIRQPVPPRAPGAGPVTDTLLGRLCARANLVRGPLPNGKLAILCPFSRDAGYADGHDEGTPSSTCLMPASAGSRLGGFHCFHRKCAGRTGDDVRKLFTTTDRWPDAPRWLADADATLDEQGIEPLARSFHRRHDPPPPPDDDDRADGTRARAIDSAVSRDAGTAEKSLRFRTAAEIEDETSEHVPWVVPGLLAFGAVTELAGKIKLAGKTTFAMEMVRAILDGADFLGKPTTQTGVLYLTEQSGASLRESLRRTGLLGRKDLVILRWADTLGMAWPDVVAAARAEAKKRGCGVLVTDTLSQFAGLRGDAENASGMAMEALEPLQRAAAEDGLAVLVVRHERKSGGDLGDAARGSSAFGGGVDIVLLLRRPAPSPNQKLRELLGVGRFDETPDYSVIERTDEGYDRVSTGEDGLEEEVRRHVLQVLPNDRQAALEIKAIVKLVNVKKTKVREVLDDLVEHGQVAVTGEGKRGDPKRYYRTDDSAESAPLRAAEESPRVREPGEEG
jgi:hypothetical protein